MTAFVTLQWLYKFLRRRSIIHKEKYTLECYAIVLETSFNLILSRSLIHYQGYLWLNTQQWENMDAWKRCESSKICQIIWLLQTICMLFCSEDTCVRDYQARWWVKIQRYAKCQKWSNHSWRICSCNTEKMVAEYKADRINIALHKSTLTILPTKLLKKI